ncbi:Hypothetical predicted protein [Pelobates cultripes]|uniref:Uncharacterized protein n=1 Tax=Pelobates cultripes TaxID=61616 RepID=A0AAD1T7N8_PELCU|nr:Hypothetical predicted protein [Pelobates cultripes]
MARYHRALEPLARQNQPELGNGHVPMGIHPIRNGVWRRSMMTPIWTSTVWNFQIPGLT